jgi:ankyrin repeat protein
MLLAAGALVNIRDHYGNTPLHRAVKDKNIGVISLLLASGIYPPFSPLPLLLNKKTKTKNATRSHKKVREEKIEEGQTGGIGKRKGGYFFILKKKLTFP